MDAQTSLTDEQFDDVVATVLDNNDGMAAATARRIVHEAMRFVATAAQHPTVPIAPSRVVDEGWHALILHTALYANMCEHLGMFVHHYPERPDATRHDTATIARTVALIKEACHTVDHELCGRARPGTRARRRQLPPLQRTKRTPSPPSPNRNPALPSRGAAVTEDEARKVARALELARLSGKAGPADRDNPAGAWRIWDSSRDITLAALDALIVHLGGVPAEREPGWHNGNPVRGFIFPNHGRG